MKNICATCGTLYAGQLPTTCPICADDRQYVTEKGQCWTDAAEIEKDHSIKFTEMVTGLHAFRLAPQFAIGQRAFLVQASDGNVLWDCIPGIDPPTISYLERLGGIKAIGISHPHYYSRMMAYAAHFNCPVYIHENDREWVMDPSERYLRLWTGDRQPLWNGIEILHTGGHFAGSAVLYLPNHQSGTLLTGDSLLVARDRKGVTAMYSYPNLIPLGKPEISRIRDVLAPLRYDALYAAFDGQDLPEGAKQIVNRSLARYLAIVGGG